MTKKVEALIGQSDIVKASELPSPAEVPPSGGALEAFREQYRFADFMSKSSLIPKHLQGKPHDCFIVCDMAQRTGASFLEVAQNLYVVHGTPAWKATFIIAQINRSRQFDENLKFTTEGEGPSLKVTCWTRIAGEKISKSVSMEMARAEGWTKNSKYKSMPEQMLTYRAACFFSRAYCPEIMFGMYTVDEVQDVEASKMKEIGGE